MDLLDTCTFRFVRYRYLHFFCLKDVLKISSRHVFQTSWRRLQCNKFLFSKTFSRHLQDVLEDEKLLRCRRVGNVFTTWQTNICWALQDFLKMSSKSLEDAFVRRLEDFFTMSWRRVWKTSWRRLENVLKTSWQDVLKTSWKRLEGVWPRRKYIGIDQDILKMSWRCLLKIYD